MAQREVSQVCLFFKLAHAVAAGTTKKAGK